jgi:hypothetical protein
MLLFIIFYFYIFSFLLPCLFATQSVPSFSRMSRVLSLNVLASPSTREFFAGIRRDVLKANVFKMLINGAYPLPGSLDTAFPYKWYMLSWMCHGHDEESGIHKSAIFAMNVCHRLNPRWRERQKDMFHIILADHDRFQFIQLNHHAIPHNSNPDQHLIVEERFGTRAVHFYESRNANIHNTLEGVILYTLIELGKFLIVKNTALETELRDQLTTCHNFDLVRLIRKEIREAMKITYVMRRIEKLAKDRARFNNEVRVRLTKLFDSFEELRLVEDKTRLFTHISKVLYDSSQDDELKWTSPAGENFLQHYKLCVSKFEKGDFHRTVWYMDEDMAIIDTHAKLYHYAQQHVDEIRGVWENELDQIQRLMSVWEGIPEGEATQEELALFQHATWRHRNIQRICNSLTQFLYNFVEWYGENKIHVFNVYQDPDFKRFYGSTGIGSDFRKSEEQGPEALDDLSNYPYAVSSRVIFNRRVALQETEYRNFGIREFLCSENPIDINTIMNLVDEMPPDPQEDDRPTELPDSSASSPAYVFESGPNSPIEDLSPAPFIPLRVDYWDDQGNPHADSENRDFQDITD